MCISIRLKLLPQPRTSLCSVWSRGQGKRGDWEEQVRRSRGAITKVNLSFLKETTHLRKKIYIIIKSNYWQHLKLEMHTNCTKMSKPTPFQTRPEEYYKIFPCFIRSITKCPLKRWPFLLLVEFSFDHQKFGFKMHMSMSILTCSCNACINFLASVSVNQKLFNCSLSQSKTDKTHWSYRFMEPNISTLLNFILPVSHWYYYCLSDFSCMFKSLFFFLNCHPANIMEDLTKMGMYVRKKKKKKNILSFVNHLTFHCSRLQLVIRDWKSTRFVKICIPLHSGSL